jgi:uncharacterized protein YjiS (DUF1127 family)
MHRGNPSKAKAMSTANSSLARSFGSFVPQSAAAPAKTVRGAWLGKLVRKILIELEVRREMRRLSSFDDAMLRDIGLNRGGIEHPLRHGQAAADRLGR